MPSPVQGPQHWRERARNARAVAAWMQNSEAKSLLLEIAERYERIAMLAQNGKTKLVAPDRD
jgi:hypothetical protein